MNMTRVVLDKEKYEGKIKNMLSDDSTYQKVSKDPAPNLERKMNKLLLSYMKCGALPEGCIAK